MKTNDRIIAVSAIIFTILFYQQNPGLNFFLFSLLLSTLILLFNPEHIRDIKWWYYVALTNICGATVMLINSDLSVFATIVSVLVLSGKSFNKHNSVFVGYLFALYSVFSSFIYWVIELSTKNEEMDLEKKQKGRRLFVGVLVAFIIAILFFLLYRAANPLFSDLTKDIKLDWINLGWVCFAFFGFLVMRGLLKSKKIELISNLELKAVKNIEANTNEVVQTQNNTIVAFSLFALLNLMLLFLNGLDIVNIYITKQLPAGITLSDFVHQSVWSTVFSIIMAVTLIMWFFSGNLNFTKQGQYIKYLVYLWILQSSVMIINTMVRNFRYISEYQLTYLRIGVFVFLTLSLIGLGFTVLKIARKKSAWQLVISNFEVWFLILALSTCVNWDNLITNYNIAHASGNKHLDKEYLLSLSDSNLPQLIDLYNDQNAYTGEFSVTENRRFMAKTSEFAGSVKDYRWQSFNLRDRENLQKLNDLKFK